MHPATDHLDTLEGRRTGLDPRPVPAPVSQRLLQRRAESYASTSRDIAPWTLDHLPPLRFVRKRSNRGRSNEGAEGRGGATPRREQRAESTTVTFHGRVLSSTDKATNCMAHKTPVNINHKPARLGCQGRRSSPLLFRELPHPKQVNGQPVQARPVDSGSESGMTWPCHAVCPSGGGNSRLTT